jgi:hypothetical protein
MRMILVSRKKSESFSCAGLISYHKRIAAWDILLHPRISRKILFCCIRSPTLALKFALDADEKKGPDRGWSPGLGLRRITGYTPYNHLTRIYPEKWYDASRFAYFLVLTTNRKSYQQQHADDSSQTSTLKKLEIRWTSARCQTNWSLT